MGKISVLLVVVCVLGLCLQASGAAPTDKLSTEELKAILTTVLEAERNSFIRSNIDIGYRIQENHEVWPSKEDGELAVKILNYFVDNRDAIRNRKVVTNSFIVVETICYPDPIGCIDPDDPGIRPTV